MTDRDGVRETIKDVALWVDLHATSVLISTMIVLLLLGYARIYTVTQDLKTEQAAACSLRISGRENTNTHDRKPLKAALIYLGNAVVGASMRQTGPQAKATLAFGNQLLTYAAQIKPLTNPKC